MKKLRKNWTTWYTSFKMPSNFSNEEATIAKLVQMKQARLQAVLTWSSKSEKSWTTWYMSFKMPSNFPNEEVMEELNDLVYVV
jgi:hypothetical protein